MRAAQLGHALISWTVSYGRPPDNLVLLEVENEETPHGILETIGGHMIVSFNEPDLGGELTALSVDDGACRQLSSVPMAFRKRGRNRS